LLAEEPEATEQAGSVAVNGYYAGTIRLKAPQDLGIMDLAIDLAANKNALAARLVTTQTEAFSGEITFAGTLVNPGKGITPTFTLVSAPFAGEISGREVVRTLTLAGEVLQGGETLRGSYSEVIEGFTPDALQVTGDFLLVRAALAAAEDEPPIIITPPAEDSVIYMPALKNQRAVAGASAVPTPLPHSQVHVYMPVLAHHPATLAQEPAEQTVADETPAQSQNRFYLPAVVNHRRP
jgi:hypothetical protein